MAGEERRDPLVFLRRGISQMAEAMLAARDSRSETVDWISSGFFSAGGAVNFSSRQIN